VRRYWRRRTLLTLVAIGGVVLLGVLFAPLGASRIEPRRIVDLPLAYPAFRQPDGSLGEPRWALESTGHSASCPLGMPGQGALYSRERDPSILVRACRAPGIPSAWLHYLLASAESEAWPRNLAEDVGFEGVPIEAPPALDADQAELTCLWSGVNEVWVAGEPCRGASYRARYGPFLVTVHFVGGGENYTVTPEAFAAMIVDLDRLIAELVASE